MHQQIKQILNVPGIDVMIVPYNLLHIEYYDEIMG